MGDVVQFHAPAPSGNGFRNASIGTSPPETSLNLLARLKEASLRPAKRLRRCDSEQAAATARSLIDRSLASAQRSIGCGSDMGPDISPRNTKSQQEIFPGEKDGKATEFIQCGMGKLAYEEPPEIYLGAWLEEFDVSVGKAAEIAGCDQSYISNIIANRKPNINVLYLLRLSDEMGVTVNDFYRPLPNKSQLAALKNLSAKAQATLLARFQKKS